MVIFRENTEDIYAGIEFVGGSEDSAKMLDYLQANYPKFFNKIRFGSSAAVAGWNQAAGLEGSDKVEVGIGIKPVSKVGTERLVRAAIQYTIINGRKSVTIVHKGNIMKFTEGGFRDWGYAVADKNLE